MSMRRHYRAPYLKNASDYRAPSGITSGDPGHVVAKTKKYLREGIPPENVIERFTVPCRSLAQLLKDKDFPTKVHLLQIDAEGTNDQVVYACDIEQIQPSLINYESMHLNDKRRSALEKYLRSHGYNLHDWRSSDTLAIRTAIKR